MYLLNLNSFNTILINTNESEYFQHSLCITFHMGQRIVAAAENNTYTLLLIDSN